MWTRFGFWGHYNSRDIRPSLGLQASSPTGVPLEEEFLAHGTMMAGVPSRSLTCRIGTRCDSYGSLVVTSVRRREPQVP